jgi:hypothetical protein
MDGKTFKMIWTNNPNYKGKDRKKVCPNIYSYSTYRVGKDKNMEIEIHLDNQERMI